MSATVAPDRRPPAIEAALELLELPAGSQPPSLAAGYIDLLGDRDATGPHPGQQIMQSAFLPRIYERLWRPVGARVLMGAIGPGTEGEHRIALEMLEISPGDRVLDIACGPGNFTRDFARAAGSGLAIGIDASDTMLAAAVRSGDTGGNLAYVRGDACDLPFGDGTFNAVCCFAALYLIDEPMTAIDEMVRVLAPGGRLGVLTSCNRGPLPVEAVRPALHALTGIRLFGRDEITAAFSELGLRAIDQRVAGFGQFVSARKPAPPTPAAQL
ncbi:MAG TPA: methyltransferase domain-containing protein [Gemmatimonadales bacterium]|nr:methyltransferase domain-containing protein [Gemmatimonadales bacterium]